jgi:hypothetical protein
LFAAAELQSQFSSINASIQSGLQNISSAAASVQSVINKTVSDFRACIKPYSNIFFIGNAIGATLCGPQLAAAALTALPSSVAAGIQAATQSFSQVLGSATSIGTQAIQSFQKTVQATASQIANNTQHTLACITQAANSTQ